MKPFRNALVIGAGSFGTSIASVISHNFTKVIIKVRSQDIYESLLKGENNIYLPGQNLASHITPALTWEEVALLCGGEVDLIVSGLPTSALEQYLEENGEYIDSYLNQEVPFISLSKGIHSETLQLPDDIFFSHFQGREESFCFLSGPSFAKEIVDEQITLVSLAGRSRSVLEKAALMLETSFFKVFPTYDIKGVLLGGALKNILAIAGGIVEGLGFNHNTRAAMITRGIHEMLRFGVVFNARPETFYGLSGMGDLILTTTGELSRNKVFGLEIAKGRKPLEIINSQRAVVEGYKTTLSAYKLAEKYKIRTTLFQAMYRILYQNIAPEQILKEIMSMGGKFYDGND